MPSKVEFIPEAAKDFERLDGSVKKEAAKKIDALTENPLLGRPLGNKFGIDLTGFYKLYLFRKKYRIVYHLIGTEIEIVEIVGIGRRDKEEIYKLLKGRISPGQNKI